MAWTMGEWWISEEARVAVEDTVYAERCGKVRESTRQRKMSKRVWSLRTTGYDSRVSDPGGTNSRCWNVPKASGYPDDPKDLESDWLLAGAEYSFNPASGEVRVEASAVLAGEDWDSVDGVSGYRR